MPMAGSTMEATLSRFVLDAAKEIYQGKRDDRVDTAWRAKAHERLEQAQRAIQHAIIGLNVAYEIRDTAASAAKEDSDE